MPFELVNISQQDPSWKNAKLGFSSDSTIGTYGCAITSVCMWLSGFGYPETPATLNAKLKQRGGFVQDAIIWSTVSAIYPKVKYKNLVLCRDTNAPIDVIAGAIAAGQPVILEVDSSPKSGLQTHWVVAYAKIGKDFLILDPWPYPTEQGKDVSLMTRYSHGKELKRSITAAIFYECQTAGDGSTPTPPPSTSDGSMYVRISDQVTAGLRMRSAPTTVSETLSIEHPGAYLKVVEAEATARPKIGVFDQWLRVRNPAGFEGYVAAWYVEAVTPASPPPSTSSTPTPTPVTPPTQPQTPPTTVTVKRIRPSVGDSLDNVPTPAPENQRLTATAAQSGTYRLVADIWNRYGGIFAPLSNTLGVEPGAAVAVFAIESGGQAFGADGRTLIRFENHLFYNYWGKNNLDKFNKFFTFDLGQRWTGHKWRSDPKNAWIDFHGIQAREWDVFNFARSLDETAAMMSISMGAPQIMGFNYAVIGYASVQDMFNAFARSDRDQVLGFFDFIQGVLPGAGAVKTLQAKNFTQFATIYNGSGQATYYGGLITNAYNAFKTLYDSLPAEPSAPPTSTPATPPTTTPPATPPTTTTPPVSTPAQPEPPVQPPASPDVVAPMMVVVLNTVGATGTAMRSKPSHTAQVVAVQPAGAVLRVLEDNPVEVRKRFGKKNEWVEVRDRLGRRGQILTLFVAEQKATPTATPASDVLGLTAPEPLTVYVSSLAGKSGLVLRVQPTSAAPTIRALLINTPLTVLGDPLIAEKKIGVFNEWLRVKEPLGAEGYVAAWYLEK
jgi:hypothetical protein